MRGILVGIQDTVVIGSMSIFQRVAQPLTCSQDLDLG